MGCGYGTTAMGTMGPVLQWGTHTGAMSIAGGIRDGCQAQQLHTPGLSRLCWFLLAPAACTSPSCAADPGLLPSAPPLLPGSCLPQGMKVAVIEGHDIGGTCVNRGCVPSKALLAASGRVRELRNESHMKALGIQVGGGEWLEVLAGRGLQGGGELEGRGLRGWKELEGRGLREGGRGGGAAPVV